MITIIWDNIVWVVFTIILVGLGLYLGAPFLDFLSPGENIWLVDLTELQNPIYLARGSETLWCQWQIWIYIAIFCLIVVLIGCVISGVIQHHVDQQLSEKKHKLNDQLEELKRSQSEFEQKKTVEIKHRLDRERQSLNIMTQEALDTEQHATTTLAKAERINKLTNNNHRAQNRENRSKLSQRDRLSDQKRLISEFLDQSEWMFPNGSSVTYAAILKLAKNLDEQKKR